MQVIVLGMHRSGTSAVTRLLNLVGCYFGPEGIATDANEENPKGFWERRDVRQVCDGLLQGSGFDWWKIAGFDVDAIEPEVRQAGLDAFGEVLSGLEAHRPWVIKEPRLCLLLPALDELLEVPLCVHVTREPLEVAASLAARNDLPPHVCMALWEVYTRASLRASSGLPRHHVRYEDLMRDPVATVHALVEWLDAEGVQGLRRPSDREITAFIDPGLHRQRSDSAHRAGLLNGQQAALAAAIEDGSLFDAGWGTEPVSAGALSTLRAFEETTGRIADLERERDEAHDAAAAQQTEAAEMREAARRELEGAQRELEAAQRELEAAQRELQAVTTTLDAVESRAAEDLAAAEATAEAAAARHGAAVDDLEGALREAERRHGEEQGRFGEAIAARDTNVRDEIKEVERSLRATEASTLWRIAERAMFARQRLTPGMARQERGQLMRATSRLAQARQMLERPVSPPGEAGPQTSTPDDEPPDEPSERLPAGVVLRRSGPASNAPPGREKVAVLAWDVGHNPLGRAYTLAEILGRRFDVEVWGAQFDRYGTELWAPLRRPAVPVWSFEGRSFPAHLEAMEQVAVRIDADAMWVSKPRLPSFGLGILAKELRNRPLVLDVDDHELAFFSNQTGLSTTELRRHAAADLELPFEEAWTRACEPLIEHADQITVSNEVLQDRFGGIVVPHARDERRFDPAACDRDQVRATLGLKRDDRLLLFGGTPRAHKGVIEVLEALERLGDPRYHLAVFAARELDGLRGRIAHLERWLLVLPHQPFDALAPLVGAADLSCVLQDPAHPVTRYQMPAKITDAMAMQVPVLVTDVPPVRPLVEAGVLHVHQPSEPLHERIAAIFDDPEGTRERANRARQLFLDEYSYAAVSERLAPTFSSLIQTPPPPSPALAELMTLPGELLRPSPPAGATPAPPVKVRQPGSRRWRAAAGEQYDLVMFWKQNDSSIYGRRQDMFLKYLQRSGRFANIIHFDSPITPERLVQIYRSSNEPSDQGRLVVRQTVERVLHRQDRERVVRRTFIYGGSRSRLLRRRSRDRYKDFVADVLQRHGVGKRLTVFWVYPTNDDLPAVLDALAPDLVVADVVDDNRTWYTEGSPQLPRVEQNYRDVLARSDVVLANCAPVAEAMTELAAEVHLVANGCELPDGSGRGPKPRELQALAGPIIGYVGNLSDRIDIDLLDDLARARPSWQLVLIGSAHLDRSVLRLDRHPNVHFLGVRRYDEARLFMQHFDVALIPHLDNVMTQSMNPLKAFVYCAAGVPVVSTPIANIDELKGVVTVAKGVQGFLDAIDEQLAGERSEPDLGALRPHTWTQRVDQVLDLIDDAAGVNDPRE